MAILLFQNLKVKGEKSMAKLTEKERESFEKILCSDLNAINAKFMNQIKDFWNVARQEVKKKRGMDKLEEEKEKLELEKKEITQRIHEIEGEIQSEDLRPEQIIELGGRVADYGRYKGANFYGIPVESQFDYDIVEYIRTNIDIEIPSKILRDVGSASVRALAMAGTFEEAREAYEKFYSLDFRKYGVDIPPRLDEVKADTKRLLYAQESLQLAGKKNEELLPEKKPEIIDME